MALYEYRHRETNQVVYVETPAFEDDARWIRVNVGGSADISVHAGDTTNVHGIPDTGQLETVSGAAAQAAAAAAAVAAAAVPLTQRGAANGVATLGADGKVPTGQIPVYALSEFLGVSANQAAMLALPGELGDWTVRTDTSTVWLVSGGTPSQLSSWTQLAYPSAPVSSVAGRTGTVVLAGDDIVSGTVAYARLPVGTTAGTVAAGDDSRFGAGGVTLTQLDAKTVLTVSRAAGADYLADGTADNVQIQAAIDAVTAAGGGIVRVRAGTYSLAATLTIPGNNVVLVGDGIGATNLVCASSMTGDTPAIKIGSAAVGTARSLTADAAYGTFTVTLSTSDAGTFAVGDWVLVQSEKVVDTEIAGRTAGEIKRITAINGVTGVVTLNDVLYDSYTTADTAKLAKLTMSSNVTVADMSITTAATTSTLAQGFVEAQWCHQLRLQRVEVHHTYYGVRLKNVVHSSVESCWIHDINEAVAGSNLRNGIWVAAAAEQIIIQACRFAQVRHAVTFGGSGYGVQRQVVVANCTSIEADTAHFDTHQACDGVVFANCVAIGGMPFGGGSSAIIGFQSRGKNVSFIGCTANGIPGRGFMTFGPVAHRTRHIGCTATNIRQHIGGGGDGIGFYIDSAGATEVLYSGCVASDCAGSGFSGAGSNHDTVVTGCVIHNSPSERNIAALTYTNSNNVTVTGCKFTGNAIARAIQMSGTTSTGWTITNNQISGSANNLPALLGTGNTVRNNIGANPECLYAAGNITGAATLTRINGAIQTATLTGNVTLTLTTPAAPGDELTIIFTQDGTGGRTVTWPGTVRLAGTLTVTAAAGAVSLVRLLWNGTVWVEVARALNLA